MKSVKFNEAEFSESHPVTFNRTDFQTEAIFDGASFNGYSDFEGDSNRRVFGENAVLSLRNARVKIPERMSFHTVSLKPSWFIDIDSRKFAFTNIEWKNHKAKKPELRDELESLRKRTVDERQAPRLLTISFRNLIANAEEFNRFEDASNFRESAFECERLERLYKQKIWRSDFSLHLHTKILCREFFAKTPIVTAELWRLLWIAPYDLIHFLYRKLSYYGESWFRAAWILITAWIFFALLYWSVGEFVGSNDNRSLGFWQSVGYSFLVMILQKPDPHPASALTYILYGVETIFAPLQAALLALAIRRKFMR